MDFRLAVLLLTLGALCVDVEGRRCGRRKLKRCQDNLETFNQHLSTLDEDEDDYPCEEAEAVRECFATYAQECYDTESEVEEFMNSNVQELREHLDSTCKAMECLGTVEEDAAQCVETVTARVMEIVTNPNFDISTINEKKIKCMVFEMLISCIMEKVEDSCGEDIANQFKEALEKQSEEMIDECKNEDTTLFESALNGKK